MHTVVTHSGSFDPDDVLAVAVVTLHLGQNNYEVIRSRDTDVIDNADWVVDVGGKYDPDKKRFDHHQNGVPKRENGIPYSAFGLVWKEIGVELCESESVANKIEERLVYPIDAADNNVPVCCTCSSDIQSYEFFDVINTFKPAWGSEEDFYTGFMRAVSFARKLLRRQIAHAKGEEEMLKLISETYEKAEEKKILIFDKPIDRQVTAGFKDVEVFVSPVFAVDTENWMAVAVAEKPQGFNYRVSFPKEWAGMGGEDLQKVSGIKDAVFCHKERYIFIGKNKESVLEAVKQIVSK